ncbi:hypothetical protein HC928_20420 [bacterium]|nr:hypothetical protein [bacterium]
MELFVNELSLHGQFPTADSFVIALKELMVCRSITVRYQYPLYCSRTIIHRPVSGNTLFSQAVANRGDITRKVMIWIDRQGPFWDEPPEHDPSEWYEWNDEVVTETSLGEASFKLSRNTSTVVVSFSPSNFLSNPLQIIWKQAQELQDTLEVYNFWHSQELDTFLGQFRLPPESWTALIEQAQADFVHLDFLPSVADALLGQPFNVTIARQALRLLRILNDLKGDINNQGAFSEAGHELLETFFRGERAYFSDESESNRQIFRKELMFNKPNGEKIFCPYHGKISHRYFRIHHSWPIRHDEPLYIAYIGPKITKG